MHSIGGEKTSFQRKQKQKETKKTRKIFFKITFQLYESWPLISTLLIHLLDSLSSNFLQLVLGAPYYGILVPGADTAEVVQRQVVNGHPAQAFRLGVGRLVPSRVRILVTHPNSILARVLVVRLVSVAAILLGRVADASQTAHRGLCQPGANFRVREEARRIGMRPFSPRPVRHDGRHPWYLTVRRELPRTGVGWYPNNDLRAGSPVLQPVPWNGIDTSPIFLCILCINCILCIFFLNYI